MFAARTAWDLEPNALSREADRMRAADVPILDLTQSNPTDCGIEYPLGLIESLADVRALKYRPSPKGNKETREAIASYYYDQGVSVSPEQIVLTASTSEAYSHLLRLLTNPQDSVLFPQPGYPLLEHLARLNDVVLRPYLLRYDSSWQLDEALLGEALRHNATKAMVIVHPNNPTGSFLKQREWQAIESLCVSQEKAVICDEVFLDYAYGPDKSRMGSLAGSTKTLTFTLGGISKMLGLPQMKVSWICISGPAMLRKEAQKRLEMIADLYLSVNTPSQQALSAWLGLREIIQDRIRARIVANRQILQKRHWQERGAEVLQAEGGWYAVLRLPALQSEEEWVMRLLKEKQVLVYPGYFFDFEKEAYLVIGLLPPTLSFERAANCIWEAIGQVSE